MTQMTAVVEDLPFYDRLELVEAMSESLVVTVTAAGGALPVLDALRPVAAEYGTLVSQIRHGLDYACTIGVLHLDGETLMLTMGTTKEEGKP